MALGGVTWRYVALRDVTCRYMRYCASGCRGVKIVRSGFFNHVTGGVHESGGSSGGGDLWASRHLSLLNAEPPLPYPAFRYITVT